MTHPFACLIHVRRHGEPFPWMEAADRRGGGWMEEVASTAAAAELMSSLLAGRRRSVGRSVGRSEEEFSHASFGVILHGCLAPKSAHWTDAAAEGGANAETTQSKSTEREREREREKQGKLFFSRLLKSECKKKKKTLVVTSSCEVDSEREVKTRDHHHHHCGTAPSRRIFSS